MKDRIIYFLPLFLLWILGWCIALIPGRLRLLLGRFVGVFLRLIKMRSNVVRENLNIVFPGQSLEQKTYREKLYVEIYHHIGTLFLELLMLFGGFRFFLKKNVTIKGFDIIEKAYAEGKNVLILASHCGNWEVTGARITVFSKPGVMVTKHLKPEFIHKAIERGRRKCNVYAAYEPQTMKTILSAIKDKKPIGCILDQYAGPPVGIRIPFFGVPVGTMTAFTYLVRKYNLLVCPSVSIRHPNGTFTVEISDPIEWISNPSPEKEIAINTAHYVQATEAHLLKNPEQWLWTHRRFKGDLSPLKEDEWEKGRLKKD